MVEQSLPAKRFDLWHEAARHGWIVALVILVLDQAFKWWMLSVYDIGRRGVVEVTGFFDLVLVWNRGISYGWLAQDDAAGRWLLIGVTLAVILLLLGWLAVSRRTQATLALGLIIGGATGNLIDRIVHGAVADFFSFHAFGYSWYVFNIADVAIVVGVMVLIHDCWREGRQDHQG